MPSAIIRFATNTSDPSGRNEAISIILLLHIFSRLYAVINHDSHSLDTSKYKIFTGLAFTKTWPKLNLDILSHSALRLHTYVAGSSSTNKKQPIGSYMSLCIGIQSSPAIVEREAHRTWCLPRLSVYGEPPPILRTDFPSTGNGKRVRFDGACPRCLPARIYFSNILKTILASTID